MPPKTKPNEKCPCGSGQKYKKCCMISDAKEKSTTSTIGTTPTSTTVLANIMSTTAMTCYHGSDEEHFAKGSNYQRLVVEWMSVVKHDGTRESYNILYTQFITKHEDLLKSSDFYSYIFAYTTEMFRNSYGSGKYSPLVVANLKCILKLGIDSKYHDSPLSADTEKYLKFTGDIQTKRGIINCLYRETKNLCDCMKPYKIEANGMEKTRTCHACFKEFPKAKERCVNNNTSNNTNNNNKQEE